ncbi:hypothetical protein QYE76_029489 [Lolium multiflorum]|uniref:Uncharacterized protein n=1 Tax=Lolium multiflorum TaxID=4521 RepID=A0AAD8QPA1_LOLMU|nr:hypothetical protein QYE76_029489 [Lolium multiflorum]
MPRNANNIDQIIDNRNAQGPSRVISKRATILDEDWDSDNSSDSDFVAEIIDSDNDIEDGDDDLYQEYADQVPKIDKKGAAEDELSEDEFLEAPDSDEETERYNFKAFTEEDMHDPKFHVGQLFQSIEMLRKAIREYSCKHRRNITLPKNDKARSASSQREPTQFTPLPESSFIQANVMNQPVQPTTVSRQENVQRKRQVIAMNKLKAAAQRRDIADQEKFDAAMAKLQQEEEKRAQAAALKKEEAFAKKLAAEEKKKAEKEAKQLAAEEKKLAFAEKKKKAQEEKLALVEKKRVAQESRKREAEATKLLAAETKKKLIAQKKNEAEEAKRRDEEEARSRLNNAIVEKMQREEARQNAWDEHNQKVEMQRQQSLIDEVARKNKRNIVDAQGSSTTSMAPYKKPREASMFDYLRNPGNH